MRSRTVKTKISTARAANVTRWTTSSVFPFALAAIPCFAAIPAFGATNTPADIYSSGQISSFQSAFAPYQQLDRGDGSINQFVSNYIDGNSIYSTVSVIGEVNMHSDAISVVGGSADATSQADYTFYVFGPDATSVPIDYIAELYVTSVGDPIQSDTSATGISEASLFIGSVHYDAKSCTSRCVSAPSGNISGSLVADTNGLISVSEFSSAEASNGGIATAIADPYFYIDPTFAAANPEYSLVFSPFVGNVAGVPEPASWALLIIGVGMVGAGQRFARRRLGSAVP